MVAPRRYRLPLCGLFALGGLFALACDPGPGPTNTPSAKAGGSCDESLASSIQAARLELDARDVDALLSSYTEHRAALSSACDQGCSSACFALASAGDSPAHYAKACELGHEHACALADGASPSSPDRCEAHEPRACAAAAWQACAAGSCDAGANTRARDAFALAPVDVHAITFATTACASGDAAAASDLLASACAAGLTGTCALRCADVSGHALVVRESADALNREIAVLIDLQSNAEPSWTLAMGFMSAEEVETFAELLRRSTPPPTEVGAKAQNKITPALREQFPALVAAIERAPQLDAKKTRYWLGRLPDMTGEQRTNLLESLRKQWWMIPPEGAQTPAGFVLDVTARAGF